MKTLVLLIVMLGGCLLPSFAGGNARFRTLYPFDSSETGSPSNGLVYGQGVFYGTTYGNGAYYDGTVFVMQPPASPGGVWTETVLHNFDSQAGDGGLPYSLPVMGPGGTLYGTTLYGGVFCQQQGPVGCGTVYELQSPATPGGTWSETVLYSFTGAADGRGPFATPIICKNPSICTEGALYGTTGSGGAYGRGTVFELKPPDSPGGSWTETVLYSFSGGDGDGPFGITMSTSGIIYGVTDIGGTAAAGAGTVFELAPPTVPGGPWTETVLYSFQGGRDGSVPLQPPLIGADGALYGTTWGDCKLFCYYPAGDGLVFELRPPISPGATWTRRVMHSFGTNQPDSPLVFHDGAFYGTYSTYASNSNGAVFKLQRQAGGTWALTILHKFPFDFPNAVNPSGNFAIDENGTIFGTTVPVGVEGPIGYMYSLAP